MPETNSPGIPGKWLKASTRKYGNIWKLAGGNYIKRV